MRERIARLTVQVIFSVMQIANSTGEIVRPPSPFHDHPHPCAPRVLRIILHTPTSFYLSLFESFWSLSRRCGLYTTHHPTNKLIVNSTLFNTLLSPLHSTAGPISFKISSSQTPPSSTLSYSPVHSIPHSPPWCTVVLDISPSNQTLSYSLKPSNLSFV